MTIWNTLMKKSLNPALFNQEEYEPEMQELFTFISIWKRTHNLIGFREKKRITKRRFICFKKEKGSM